MPSQISELQIMDEDRLIEEVLDKFVNCHEQTYEEFLSTLPHLSKEDNVTKREAFGTDSSENILTSIKFPHENAPNDHHLRNKAIFLRTLSQCSEEEQIVMDEGQKVGSSFQGDLSRAGKVKMLGDEVQPFSLDEEFDYDAVTLTPKFTPAEMDAIKQLSAQKGENSSTDAEGPRD
ncbi:intraflagellar transport-associated protein isoform X2 [Equus quagga]|uniref:intraflagellar transport-associated protein isoform X2 n=1 Tax=Equus quagga TaxID=89248 RepID=UPI001EE31FD2|nr:intraflagellar transport-associated protein isoform X2 [Equus quagga]